MAKITREAEVIEDGRHGTRVIKQGMVQYVEVESVVVKGTPAELQQRTLYCLYT